MWWGWGDKFVTFESDISGQSGPFYTHFTHLKKNGKSTHFNTPPPPGWNFPNFFPSILKPSLSVYHVRGSECRITRPVLTGQAEPLLYFHNKHVTQCNLRVKYFFLIEAARLRGWREVKYSLFFVESWYYWQYLVYIRINEHQRCISLSRQSEEYSPQTSDKHYVNWDKHQTNIT